MKPKHVLAYMECAEAFAKCSSGERLKVGSVIVKNNRIVSCGYNGLPEHLNGPLEEKVYLKPNGEDWLDIDYIESAWPYVDKDGRYKLVTRPEVRHSEKNALMGLIKSNESAVGATLFCTHACCKYCAIDIVDSGIIHVIYKHEYRCSEGLTYLKDNGILCEKFENYC